MIMAGDFRKGNTIDMDGKIFVVVEFQHVKPGKGAAFVRAKIKNIITGQVLEQTFNPSDKFPQAVIERKNMQYSYNDDGIYYFMDLESFEMLPLNYDIVADTMQYVKEEMSVQIVSYKGVPFSVEPPTFVELVITETEPGFQGDTSKAGTKPATLETGLVIGVPLFIMTGEKIKVDTRDGSYVERVK
ncbi:MAG: elongation factor P [Firmicutes bacterium]|nr:elongation factor P [Bacillota bacterium]MCL2255770.1 elongation factor P [Bacillota bacterium]